MEFEIRRGYHPEHRFVKVFIDNTSIDLGLLDEDEAKSLAQTLRDAADRLEE